MRCVIMQPTFFPWLGYFHLIDQADMFIFLDDVQLSKQSWQTRNRIKTKDGELILTVPVIHGKHKEQLIKDTVIHEYERFARKTIKTLEQNYSRAPHFEEPYHFLVNYFMSYLNDEKVYLGAFNANLIVSLAASMGLTTHKFYNLSTRIASGKIHVEGEKDHRLVSICKAFECTEYLSPQGSSAYLEHENPGGAFEGSGIKLEYQNYKHPEYPQLHGDFLPYMGIVDLLFNKGFKDAMEVVRLGARSDFSVEEFRQLKGIK